VFEDAIQNSAFKVILNEKEHAKPAARVEIPDSFEAIVVPPEVEEIRGRTGLRKTLLTQTKR